MKNTMTKWLLILLALLGTGMKSEAQTRKPNWEFSTQCLKMTAWPVNISPDSCIKVYWQVNGVASSSWQLSHTFTKPGTYQVCMKVLNSCRKWDTTICKSVKVDTCPTNPCDKFKPDFSWKADCRKVRFVATSGMNSNTGVTWKWTFGNGATASTGDPTYTYVKDGVYKVCLVASWTVPGTNTVCRKEICKEIKIQCSNPCNIKGDFKFSVGNNGQVKFWASSNNGFSYSWNFGDGNKGFGASPSHWYKKPGRYNVCVRICDKTERCCTTICKVVIIEEPCRLQGSFTWKNLGNNSFKFYAFSSGNTGATYFWNFGDGSTGTGKDPQHTYSKPGVYNVCVTIISANRRCKIQICRRLVIEAPRRCDWSKAGFGISSTTRCAVVNVEAFNLSDPCIQYQWTVNGTPVDSAGGRLKTISFPKNGVYKVCLKLINTCRKCDTVICKEVKVSCFAEKCNWKARGADFAWSVKCPNLILEANNLNNGCIRYQFTVMNSSGSPLATFNGRTQNIGFSKNGDYYVCMKLTDTCNQCDTTICKKITINCQSPCNWKAAGAGFAFKVDCRKVSVTANSMNNSCLKYKWTSGGQTFSTGSTGTISFNATGTYTVCLTLVDTCKSCDTTICQSIKIDCNPCQATAKFRIDSVSRKGVVYVTNQSTGAFTYSWNWGDSTYSRDKSPGSHAYKYSGSKKICLTVWDSLGKCSTTFCLTTQVVVGRSNGSQQRTVPTGSISVFPNPGKDRVNVTWDGNMNRMQIINLNGAVIMETSVSGGQTTIDAGMLKEGVYLIRLSGEQGFATARMLIGR